MATFATIPYSIPFQECGCQDENAKTFAHLRKRYKNAKKSKKFFSKITKKFFLSVDIRYLKW